MIYQISNHRVLITEALKIKMGIEDEKLLYEALLKMFREQPLLFETEILPFDLSDEEIHPVLVELLKDYASGMRGKFYVDTSNPKVYWLKIWINGNFMLRALKLSDAVNIKIALEEVAQIVGKVEDFTIVFNSGGKINFANSMMITL